MKKIFTLISVALAAMSVNAQEVWNASDLDLNTAITSRENASPGLKKVPNQYPGDAPVESQIKADATESLTLTDYIFTVSTDNVTLTGVSTPNSDGTQADAWRMQAGAGNNQALDLDDCPIKWTNYVNAKTGNPAMEAIEYFFTNSDNSRVGPRYLENFWEPGCGQLPAKGEYFEVTFAKAGTFMAGMFINRPNSNLYILNKETIQLIPAANIKIEGYVNNNGVIYGGLDKAYQTLKVNDDYTISHSNPEIGIPSKQILAFVTFDVEAKTYLMFNPKNQLGIYGFYFQAGSETAISNVKAATESDAPIYNLAGQKVDKGFKGVVIQNGKKMIQK